MGACLDPPPDVDRFLVLEYMAGGTLRDLVRQPNFGSCGESGSFPVVRVLEILHDVCKGMAYLHGKDPPTLHGDLTSSNILLGNEGTAKVSDFGIARWCCKTSATTAAVIDRDNRVQGAPVTPVAAVFLLAASAALCAAVLGVVHVAVLAAAVVRRAAAATGCLRCGIGRCRSCCGCGGNR